jgi:hypothetical protein
VGGLLPGLFYRRHLRHYLPMRRCHRRCRALGYPLPEAIAWHTPWPGVAASRPFQSGATLLPMIEYAKPAAETEEGRQRLSVYYLALGRFAHRFALAEQGVHFVLRHYAGMKTDVARALLSGVRVRETERRLSRLHDIGAIPDDKWSDLKGLFDQLSIINSARDGILSAVSAFETAGGFRVGRISGSS